jgi:glyoxylase-like metal-dependent hydrolase (beta-lactamase superfamily II)
MSAAEAGGYTGDLVVGGPAQRRTLGALAVTKVAVGAMDNNAYLLECRRTGERCLVDAADDPRTLLALLGDGSLARVLTTHRHADHWQALEPVVRATGAVTAAGRDDAEGIPVPTRELLDDGATVQVGDVSLEVITLVGHTPGSVALLHEDPDGTPHLWTGDSLFPGGVGRTWSPEDFVTLIDDVERKVFGRLPDETWVYPGHGGDTTLGAERASLPEWRDRGW